jgi:hypothetical protein
MRDELVTGNGQFKKERLRGWDGQSKLIIDYVIFTRAIRNKLTNVRVFAGINFGSNCCLLVVKPSRYTPWRRLGAEEL